MTNPICMLCDEPVKPHEDRAEANMVAHRECMLREVAGGIGHHIAHEYWCLGKHDPDAGLTRRQSSLLVDLYIHLVGVEGAISKWQAEQR